MANITVLTNSEFTKYITQPNLKNEDFKKILEDLNEKYCEISQEIINKNEERSDILNKLREAQQEYKKMLGLNELTANSGQDDINEDDMETEIQVKPSKRGRKKNEDVKVELNDNIIEETLNIPETIVDEIIPAESKKTKKTKSTDKKNAQEVKEVKEVKEAIEVKKVDVEEPVKEVIKLKGKKKTEENKTEENNTEVTKETKTKGKKTK